MIKNHRISPFFSIFLLRNDEQKKTIFLVNSVALVHQQAKFLEDNTPYKTKSYCGADNVDDWGKEKWEEEFKENQILVMIHQVFLNTLLSGFFTLDRVNLLIFDECHHTLGNSVYKQIMDRYHKAKEQGAYQMPRILGLSASIVTKRVDMYKFVMEKQRLEKEMDAKVITTENLASLIE